MPRARRPAPTESLRDFIAAHAVFRFDEATATLRDTTPESIAAGLNYHLRMKHVRRLRRGLYCRLPTRSIDPWLIGSRLTSDAVIGYQSALRFHEDSTFGYSCEVLTQQRFSSFIYNDVVYRAVRLKPRSATELKRGPRFHDGIVEAERDGVMLRVCTRERAYADCFDRIDLTDGLRKLAADFFEERSLDIHELVSHVLANGSRIAAARVGLLMEEHKTYSRAKRELELLQDFMPKTPTVFDPDRHQRDGGHLVWRWNAIIPPWFHELRGSLM